MAQICRKVILNGIEVPAVVRAWADARPDTPVEIELTLYPVKVVIEDGALIIDTVSPIERTP